MLLHRIIARRLLGWLLGTVSPLFIGAVPYAAAGFRPSRHNACSLKNQEHIRARVHEIQSRNLQIQDESAQISSAQIAEQLARAFDLAEKLKRPGDMANITVAQAKAAGKWVERSEVAQTNEFAGLSLEDMRRELVERARKLGLDRHLAGLLEGPDRADGRQDEGDGELN
jgi:hypothetical protein